MKWKSPGFPSLSVFSLHCMVFRTTKASACTSNRSGSHAQGEPCWLAVCLYHSKDTLTQVQPRIPRSFSAKPFSSPSAPSLGYGWHDSVPRAGLCTYPHQIQKAPASPLLWLAEAPVPPPFRYRPLLPTQHHPGTAQGSALSHCPGH